MFGSELLPDRFWNKATTDPSTGCWLWIGATTGNGYGNFRFKGKNHAAHRVSRSLLIAEVEAELDLDHLCRTRSCINPDHLEPVSRRENVLRGLRGRLREVTEYCSKGHAYDVDNLKIEKRSDGRTVRRCKKCRRVADAKRRLLNKGEGNK